MLEILKQLIAEAAPGYLVEYDEASMLNVKADNVPYYVQNLDGEPVTDDEGFPVKSRRAYIEEFRSGRYNPLSAFPSKTTRAQIYFFQLTQFQNDAITREQIRGQIEEEAVFPFIEAYKNNMAKYGLQPVDTWGFGYPPARFDANEVSVMLEFDFLTTFCRPTKVRPNTRDEAPAKDPCDCGKGII